MRLSDLSLSVAVTASILFVRAGAQEQPAAKARRPPTAQKAADASIPGKAKMTPQQERGLRLLNQAQAEAAGLGPEMRTYVLWQISRAYEQRDSAKEGLLLKNAFQASLSIEGKHGDAQECQVLETCDLKSSLQRDILGDMLQRSPDALQPILAKAEPDARKHIMARLLQHYAQQKKFDQALELLNQLADDDTYPYSIAGELMALLPQERDFDRLAVFSQALNNYQQHGADVEAQYHDFATMVVRFWQHLPSALVMDAIDSILEKARDAKSTASQLRVGISTDGGDAYFGSLYQYRLFELLPVIEQLDKSKAERLLQESSEVRSSLDRYPKGLSLTPSDYTDHPPANGERSGIRSMGFTTGDNPAEAALNQAKAQRETETTGNWRKLRSNRQRTPNKHWPTPSACL